MRQDEAQASLLNLWNPEVFRVASRRHISALDGRMEGLSNHTRYLSTSPNSDSQEEPEMDFTLTLIRVTQGDVSRRIP